MQEKNNGENKVIDSYIQEAGLVQIVEMEGRKIEDEKGEDYALWKEIAGVVDHSCGTG